MVRLHAWTACASATAVLHCTERLGARCLVPAALLACILLLSCRTPAQACVGDCNGDHHVTVNEILTMVNVALAIGT